MAKTTDNSALLARIRELEEKLEKVTMSPEATTSRQMEEYVEVELIRDNGAYKDDVFVSVNGENCLIRRGVPVKIKRKFADVLEQSHQQDIAVLREIERLEAAIRLRRRSGRSGGNSPRSLFYGRLGTFRQTACIHEQPP